MHPNVEGELSSHIVDLPVPLFAIIIHVIQTDVSTEYLVDAFR